MHINLQRKHRLCRRRNQACGETDINTSRGEKDNMKEKDVSIVATKKNTKLKVQGSLDRFLVPVNKTL